MNTHAVLAVAASVLGVIVSGAYCWQAATQPGKAPHVVKWALLTAFAAIICAAQVSAGAGLGALVLAVATVTNGTNVVIGLAKRGTTDITGGSLMCATAGAAAVVGWWLSGDPTLAAVLISAAALFAFLPTVLRAWHEPETEVQNTYWWNTLRYALATLAVERMSVATALYPATWVAINGAFSVYHASRLKQVRAARTAVDAGGASLQPAAPHAADSSSVLGSPEPLRRHSAL